LNKLFFSKCHSLVKNTYFYTFKSKFVIKEKSGANLMQNPRKRDYINDIFNKGYDVIKNTYCTNNRIT
jgi:hypothetical protein